ncbi:cytochrome d ubiquinol oxidase subunit II [Parenemella sanctibonifatiensis]|uniref:Cytochrome d ubiquinol oxidase subunit II n=1 Tax=Parenemella sanctibonifatiensis TaxID=2016505 RepID=A0A255EIW5_9ACTN|nr:cytochrome d ubiquinol oxidase subunit II [Parenemella sanctibonifatiensis]
MDPSLLPTIWFILIAVLWLGYFVLEGFDYGVAMLLPILGKTDKKRRVMINTIGPLWDGNEVWLLTAGGATFAAFPGWYATLFSGLYLPLLLVLVGLILRGVAFEYRAKRDDARWRAMFDWFAIVGSFVPSLVWGVGFANFVVGLPVNADHIFIGSFWSLFGPFQLLGGVMAVALFLTHGAIFIALKTRGEIHEEAKAFAWKSGIVTVVLVAALVVWQNLQWGTGVAGWVLAAVAIVAIAAATALARAGREGWAFAGTALATLAIWVGFFVTMYPDLGFDNSLNQGAPLDLWSAASTEYTLTIMTWAAVVFVPIVLCYQAWSYWVFRKRLSVENLPDDTGQAEAEPEPQRVAAGAAPVDGHGNDTPTDDSTGRREQGTDGEA